jgi:hypothetical protein
MNPFDFVNTINYTKENIIRESDNPELAEKIYEPYLVNKSLSYFIDTVRLANEMNIHHTLDKKLQYEFFLNIVRKHRRFKKWKKTEEYADLDLIKRYFNYSTDKAKQALLILGRTQLDTIKQQLQEGGRNEY